MEFLVYGPGTPLCSPLGYYKQDAGPDEYGVSTGTVECANGGHAHDPVNRFTKGSAARNQAAAEAYARFRNSGDGHEVARAKALADWPAHVTVVEQPSTPFGEQLYSEVEQK